MIAPLDRETFDRAQRRHRRSARLRAIPAALAAAVMGIPLGVYLSPVLLALSIVITDLVNLLLPMPDLGRPVMALLDRLLEGDPGTLGAIGGILFIWVLPGIGLLVLAYLLVAWRLRGIGGDGIAAGLGGRAPRADDAQERQLVNVVTELAVAAGMAPPTVLLYDEGPANAMVFGRDPDHATVLVARGLLDELDREETQGVVARLVASGVGGDLGLAVDIAAVYVTYGLLTTTLSAAVSGAARARWRGAVSALAGRRASPRDEAAGIAALLGLPPGDDIPDNTAAGCLTLLTMGGFIAVGISLVNQFLSGPLLTWAWRPRGYLADATAVELTRDPDGLARALTVLGDGGRAVPGTAWLELLLVVGGSGAGSASPAGAMPRLSDTGLTTSLAPPVSKRLRRLQAMGATLPVAPVRVIGSRAERARGRLPGWLLVVIIAPLLAIVGVLVVIAAALIVYLAAFAAFIVLVAVAGPLHEILRGLAVR